jgi:hypothetical protein
MKAMLLLLAGMLTACQSWQARAPEQKSPPPHRGAGTGAGSSGAAGSGTASGSGPGLSQEPCEQHPPMKQPGCQQ